MTKYGNFFNRKSEWLQFGVGVNLHLERGVCFVEENYLSAHENGKVVKWKCDKISCNTTKITDWSLKLAFYPLVFLFMLRVFAVSYKQFACKMTIRWREKRVSTQSAYSLYAINKKSCIIKLTEGVCRCRHKQ